MQYVSVFWTACASIFIVYTEFLMTFFFVKWAFFQHFLLKFWALFFSFFRVAVYKTYFHLLAVLDRTLTIAVSKYDMYKYMVNINTCSFHLHTGMNVNVQGDPIQMQPKLFLIKIFLLYKRHFLDTYKTFFHLKSYQLSIV